ncbi:MAG: hypothetical protein WBS24_04355 [Terriglobales bacterium]
MKSSQSGEERPGGLPVKSAICAILSLVFLGLAGLTTRVHAREKDVLQYGEGLIVNIPIPTDEVERVVEEVAANGIIRGTKEYQKDEYIHGAEAANSTPLFPAWTDPGKVFYKVRKQALNPWNFKNSADVGTLAVRYVVQPQGDKNTVLRIDALFVEDNRHSVHQSNGSVETSEYKDIQDHIGQIELMKKETAEAEELKRQHVEKQNFGLSENTELLSTPNLEPGESSSLAEDEKRAKAAPPEALAVDANETPEQRLARLRREVERLVKKPGAPLKSAPFHTASTLKSLDAGTDVLIVIVTPYWLGVETHDGQHGWISREQLESLP